MTQSSRAFYHNVHHHGHWAAAAYGCLKPFPVERLRGAFPHLSYNMKITLLLGTIKAEGLNPAAEAKARELLMIEALQLTFEIESG